MSFRDSRRRAARALVLTALVVLPALPVRALPLDGGGRFRDDRGGVTSFFEELRSFWRGMWGSSLTKEGVLIDPNGRPPGGTTPPPSVTPNEGSSIDPHG
jgi:hypothetical protein